MKNYIDNKVNLTGIDALEITEIFELPANELLLKHEDCCLVWQPCDGTLYADDRDTLNEKIANTKNIFGKGNFAEVIRDYYGDTSELVTMFKSIFELNANLSKIMVADSFDNHSIELGELIKELERIVFTKKELFMNQAPSWNFELGEDELLAKALEVGFVTEIGDDQYLVNNDY